MANRAEIQERFARVRYSVTHEGTGLRLRGWVHPRQLDRALIVQDGETCVLNEYSAGIGKIGYSFCRSRVNKRKSTSRSSILGNLLAKAGLRDVEPHQRRGYSSVTPLMQ